MLLSTSSRSLPISTKYSSVNIVVRKINHPREKILFFLGVFLYALLLRLIGITCPIRHLLGIPCPGCGITRALISALLLDFGGAFAYHPLWIMTPIIILYILCDGRLFGKIADRIIISLTCAAFVAVWVLRLAGILPCL